MNTINGTISLAKVRQTYIRVLFSPGVAQNMEIFLRKKKDTNETNMFETAPETH